MGCQIYESIGVPVQKTLLGTFTVRGKEKVVVACKDFTSPGVVLQDFASLKNQMIDSERNGYGTELTDILYTFEEQTAIDSKLLIDRFWEMFIADALIGNWDRHNGNWGFLYDTQKDTMELAPVYDCGSCLYPQAGETIMEAVLEDEINTTPKGRGMNDKP
ncbi:HipA domain-containing protein [uncultured Neglectibacter sp.]|uniref:HipA domain-containing protein n=1 Tax=uncultured Neglectibacter sp. TaxID=1924108 RepID=UPI0034DE36EA